MSRRDRAVRLRQLALSALRARGGCWRRNSIGAFLSLDTRTLRMAYRTPFQRLPQPEQQLKYWAAIDGPKIELLPYGLDIWVTGKKVLDIAWSEGGAVELISYGPGDWEADLERLAII